jgi:hypothetical protein
VLTSRSVLRFLTADDIAERIAAAGLQVARLQGGWSNEVFDANYSQEMIFAVTLP